MAKTILNSDIEWEKIKPLVEGKYKVFFEQIDSSLYQLILDEKNEFTVKKSIFKLLKNDKTIVATQDNVNDLYSLIMEVAKHRSTESLS